MIRVQLVGGPLDGREVKVPSPPPTHLMIPHLAGTAMTDEWNVLLPPLPFDPDPGPPLAIPVPDLLQYVRDVNPYHTGHMIRYTYR